MASAVVLTGADGGTRKVVSSAGGLATLVVAAGCGRRAHLWGQPATVSRVARY